MITSPNRLIRCAAGEDKNCAAALPRSEQTTPQTSKPIQAGDIVLDPAAHTVTKMVCH
jgi:DNA-binding response OmpR family regulator